MNATFNLISTLSHLVVNGHNFLAKKCENILQQNILFQWYIII